MRAQPRHKTGGNDDRRITDGVVAQKSQTARMFASPLAGTAAVAEREMALTTRAIMPGRPETCIRRRLFEDPDDGRAEDAKTEGARGRCGSEPTDARQARLQPMASRPRKVIAPIADEIRAHRPSRPAIRK